MIIDFDSRLSEVNQYSGAGGLKNKSELLSHFSSSFVCFAYTNGNYSGGGGFQRPCDIKLIPL
jgi:hypothetical protein